MNDQLAHLIEELCLEGRFSGVNVKNYPKIRLLYKRHTKKSAQIDDILVEAQNYLNKIWDYNAFLQKPGKVDSQTTILAHQLPRGVLI